MLKQTRMATIMNSTKDLEPEALCSLLSRLETFVDTFTKNWLSMNLDAVLTPAGVLPAIPHNYSSELFGLNAHFLLYNLLDFPAGVVPVKFV